MDEKPLISLKNVNKIFKLKQGLHQVLFDISFEVKKGEVIALIGPSGSGKSTCLRTINALETIHSGSIEVCDMNYRDPKFKPTDIRRSTGMIFQRFELFPHLTALENVSLGPKNVLKKESETAKKIALELLEQVGLKDHVHKYPKNLSGGQQQRVAIARALSVNPKILLCDEPTSALDPELVDEVVKILLDIAKQGMTMIVVTHELNFAKKVSNRTIFLEHGKIVEMGETKELFDNPKTERLKQFLKRVSHVYE